MFNAAVINELRMGAIGLAARLAPSTATIAQVDGDVRRRIERIEIIHGLKQQGADLHAEDFAGNTAEKLCHGERCQPGRN